MPASTTQTANAGFQPPNTPAPSTAASYNTYNAPSANGPSYAGVSAPAPISLGGLSSSETPISLPQAPAPANPALANASIPSITSIVQGNEASTPAETQQSDILSRIAAIQGGNTSLNTLQTQQETQAGIPAMAKTVSDLTTKLQGLSDQSDLLAGNAAPGGTIQNTEQNNAEGRGITAGGLAPLTAADLRNNQVQQSAVAAQSLTVKSALYAAQGNYSLAKTAADQAAQVQFDGVTQQLNYQKALLDAITPQLTKDDAARAATMQAQLTDRATQVAQQKDDFKTGQALALAAMQNNASDPGAQYAAQEALKLDPTDPQYLQKVTALVGKYQTDQVKEQLGNQLTEAQIGEATATTAKTYSDIANSNLVGNTAVLSPYMNTFYDGTQYADLSSLTPSDKVKYAQVAQAAGIKPILDTATASKLNAISASKENLTKISDQVSGILNTTEQPSSQGIGNSIKSFLGNADIKAFSAWRTAVINNVQALAGGQGSGLRINQSEIDTALQNDLPVITGPGADNLQTAQKKIANLNEQLDTWSKQILGGGNQAATSSSGTTVMTGPDRKQYNVPNGQVAAFKAAGGH